MSDSQAPETPAQTAPALAAPLPVSVPLPRFLAVLVKRPYALLALLGLLLWLPGILSLPALDRDESRFAQSSRQMVETGNLVDIRFGHVPRYKKPIGIYWLQSASTAVLGMGSDSRIWTYRVPSLLGGIAAAWATVWCALAFAGAEVALVAGLLMLGSVLLTAEATIATTDAVLLACVLGVQGVLLRVYRGAREPDAPEPSSRLIWLGWVACAAGILVKFPVVPGVAIVTVVGLVAWDRDWRWLARLKPARGFLLTLLLVMPWLIAITIQSRGAFLEQSLGNDFAAKIAGGQESHGMWPGYYLLLSAASFWPAILFIAPGVVIGIARRGEPAIRFLLVWAGAWWLLVEAVPTKLPHYVLSSYPALAILGALFVLTPPDSVSSIWITVARWIAAIQFAVGAALLAAGPVVLPRLFGIGDVWWLMALAGAGSCLAIAALVFALRRIFAWAVMLSVLAMLVFVPVLTAGTAPRLSRIWVSRNLKPMVVANTQPGDPPPALAGYEEPSLVFALGADVVLTDGTGAADAGAKAGGLALVEDQEKGAFLARLAELQSDATPVGDLDGFNYSRGRKVHVALYRMARLRGQ
jgi:4-amino-4-deoxy-L-arabinose transferase-like glycosyltransferase